MILPQLAFLCWYKCTRIFTKVVRLRFGKLSTVMRTINFCSGEVSQSKTWPKGLLISVKLRVVSNSSTIGSHLLLIRSRNTRSCNTWDVFLLYGISQTNVIKMDHGHNIFLQVKVKIMDIIFFFRLTFVLYISAFAKRVFYSKIFTVEIVIP